MPNSFFDKLNTLVKAHVNSVINPVDERSSRSRRKALSRQDIRRGLQGDVDTLRKRINEALEYQDGLQKRVDQLYAEIREWDQKADQAVQEGRENDARFAVRRMQQAQRDLEMTEADLREHEYITQDLISQVNMLDGVIQEAPQETRAPQGDAEREDEDVDSIGEQIVQQLDSTRQKLSDLVNRYTRAAEEYTPEKRPEADDAPAQPTTHPVDDRKVDDDLSARLARLSKPEKGDDKK